MLILVPKYQSATANYTSNLQYFSQKMFIRITASIMERTCSGFNLSPSNFKANFFLFSVALFLSLSAKEEAHFSSRFLSCNTHFYNMHILCLNHKAYFLSIPCTIHFVRQKFLLHTIISSYKLYLHYHSLLIDFSFIQIVPFLFHLLTLQFHLYSVLAHVFRKANEGPSNIGID